MPKWSDIANSEAYQSLSPEQQQIKKFQFWNDTVVNSPKYKSWGDDLKNKAFENFFPKGEYFKIAFREGSKGLVEEWKNLPGVKQGDVGVNKVADVITGEVKAEGNHLVQFPRFLAGEIVRSYEPSTLLPFLGATKVVKPILKPAGKFIVSHTPKSVKDFLLKNITLGKGQPIAYQAAKESLELEKSAGIREAEKVAKDLTTMSTGLKVASPEGINTVIKKGQPIPIEHQKYIGRIMRKEIDLGGKESFVNMPVEESVRMAKHMELEVAFNPKIQQLQKDLESMNRMLRNKETLASGLVGKEFKTQTGFIEKVTDVSKTPKIKLSGEPSTKRFDIGLKTEPTLPKPPTETNIPQEMFPEDEIVRGIKQITQAESTNQFVNLSRKELLKKRKLISNTLQQEIKDVELAVKSNYYIFDRTFTEQIRTNPRFRYLSKIANEGRDVMDKWSAELAKSGIPKEQAKKVIEDNIGQYMARMYTTKLKKDGAGFGFNNLKMRLNGLKHRKDLSNEVRLALGEIKEPALPTAIRVKEISTSIANNKLFNTVVKNPEWVANSNISGNMVKMADTPALGALRNKWVIPSIAEDINAIAVSNTQGQSLYLKSLNAWKYGKVVLNPATHTRNMISNSILLDLSGVSQLKQAKLLPRVINDYLSKGEVYKLAVENGAIGGEFIGGEIKRLKMFYDAGNGGHISKLLNTVKMPFRKLGNIYQAEEQLAKLMKFTDMLDKGFSPQIAAQEAQKWLFDYSKVPKFIDIVRKSPVGAPFVTFTYKAIPRIAETLVDKPLKLYKYYALFNGWNEASRKLGNMTPDEYARQTKLLPPWLFRTIGGIPANLLMPYQDKYKRTQWMNLEYILPIGMAPEIVNQGILKGGVSNPFINIIMDLSKNSDFKGQPIVPIGATKEEAAQKRIEYIYRQLIPSLAPAIPGITKGGYSFEKIISAIYKRPDYAERIKGITPTLLDTLAGIKLTPLDVDESEMFNMLRKKSDIEELQKQILKLQHPAISEEEKEKQSEIIFQKMQRIMEQ